MGPQKKISDNSKQSGILCRVPCCGKSRRKHSNIRFFRVPRSDSTFGKTWREKCKMPLKDYNKKYMYICENHFSSECKLKKRLKKCAIPTLNLDDEDTSSTNVQMEQNGDETEYEVDIEDDYPHSLNGISEQSESNDIYLEHHTTLKETNNVLFINDSIDLGPVKIEGDMMSDTMEMDSEDTQYSLLNKLDADGNPDKLATELENIKLAEQSDDEAFLQSMLPYIQNLDMKQKMLLRMEIQRIVYNHTYPK